jgi:hypothetical protein
VKVYSGSEKGAAIGKTSGFFGGAVLEKFDDRAVEDEGRLKNLNIREHFLTRIFAFARFRRLQQSASMHDLVRFHASNKLLLMAYSQTKLRELGRIVANADGKRIGAVLELYGKCFREAFRKPRDTRHRSMSLCILSVTSRRSYPSGKSGTSLRCWKRIVMEGHP